VNVLLAVILTDVMTHPFKHYHGLTAIQVTQKEFLLSAIGAFGLGFSVYWTWRQPTSKWVWAAGLCWFASRAIPLWLEQRAMLFGSPHTLWGQMSGADCAGFAQSCLDAITYSVVLVRTICFAIGAHCAALFLLKKSS
jgi:hypothetical protein